MTFSTEERAAMKARAAELKQEQSEAAVLAKIAEMPQPDRGMAERLLSIVAEAAPDLRPKLYYGQPGWARNGKVVVFFRSGQGDKARYSTLGFSPEARLDDGGGLWPTSYALEHLDDAGAAVIAQLVKRV
ncbi:DUF1801 domain-containing protein [Actinoplanes sp. NPDC049596]|uniref:DUF1801 domain-containing protein n=1 Tax=unclassified Actinoplanes TaxID=2626549 RepID=UPI003413CC9F